MSGARAPLTTQAHVWIENRAPTDAVPVIVEALPSPVAVRLDAVVRTAATAQNWEYRTMQVTGNLKCCVPARLLTDARRFAPRPGGTEPSRLYLKYTHPRDPTSRW